MIPKIIHYVWLGGVPMPQEITRCIDSWRRAMPDYKLRLWTEADMAEVNSPFADEALTQKKWAFASDVIRLHALYKYGGIYLDTDVLVYKSFDALLGNRVFSGRESSMHLVEHRTINYLTTCCIGAEPGAAFIKRCLDYYKGRHFVTSTDTELPEELRLDLRLNSEVMCILAEQAGYNASIKHDVEQHCEDGLVVYPSEFFDPVGRRERSFCRHLALGTWRSGERKVWTYTWRYKIAWRVWAVVERVLDRFDRILIKKT